MHSSLQKKRKYITQEIEDFPNEKKETYTHALQTVVQLCEQREIQMEQKKDEL